MLFLPTSGRISLPEMLFKIKIGPQLNHPIPERRVSLVARCGRGQAGGISLPRWSGKPGRNLGCHRDMLAVEDKVLEHADHRQHGRQRRILEVDRRVIRRRERRPV
jgi:hypothetical protein